jgi:putative ABC transport system substrate-binding protein
LRGGLARGGYVEGRNVRLEYRWAQGEPARLPALAADLVGRRVDLIVAASGQAAALAAKQATRSIPVVFCMGADPVQAGLVETLNRPGGNVTGVFMMEGALQAKRLELLHELAPQVRAVIALVNPGNPQAETQWDELRAAARGQGLELRRVDAGNDAGWAGVGQVIAAARRGALTVIADSFLTSRRDRIVAVAARHRLPAVFYLREYVAAGGLMSYGVGLAQFYEQAGEYVARILKGARPQTLPVAAPARFELAINLRAAAALGLQVPVGLLARADELVQ